MKMDTGRHWLLKTPAVFKNVINLPSSFSLHGQLGKSQGWAAFAVGVCVSKTHFCICIKFPSVSRCSQIRHYLGMLSEGWHFKFLPCFCSSETEYCWLLCPLGSFDPHFDPANESLSAKSNFTSCYYSSKVRTSFSISAEFHWKQHQSPFIFYFFFKQIVCFSFFFFFFIFSAYKIETRS